MQKFMVVMFQESKQRRSELIDWLTRMREEGRYAAEDMSTFYFNACPSGLILIDFAKMDLGRAIVDMGYKVRHQIYVDLT